MSKGKMLRILKVKHTTRGERIWGKYAQSDDDTETEEREKYMNENF